MNTVPPAALKNEYFRERAVQSGFSGKHKDFIRKEEP